MALALAYDADDKEVQDKKGLQRRWLKNIQTAEKYFSQWQEKGDKVVKLYRKQTSSGTAATAKRSFAMLWANTEVMKPVIYALTPEPAIARRFKDRDPAGKTASEILERACSYQFELCNLDDSIKAARDDMLLPGRGVCWVRFVKDGELAVDYVHWRDFLHIPARRWSQVTWVGKRSWFSKEEMKKRFEIAPEKMGMMSPDSVPKSSGMTEEERKALEGKYAIWEIWDKVSEKVYFITPSSEEPLEVIEPYLSLTGFWPCPQPIYATMTTDSMVPVPDYQYYQDQAEEIDDLTRRISSLTDSLKVVGFYPRGQEDSAAIESALQPGTENKMIGVESWAAFAEKGGGKAIIFLPIDMVVQVIQACVELRQQLIQDVYQITGISDIMRGATDPNETLGAQELKAQTGSVRVRNRQQDVQRFARDITRIACEIMAEKFSPGVLMAMTNQNTEENQTPEKIAELEAAFQLLQNDQLRSFQIEVETDSTIQPDEQAEKEARIEFIQALGGFIQQAVPVAMQMPDLMPIMGESLRFMVRGFKAGSGLEDVIDKTMDEMRQKQEQAAQQPPPPDPAQQAAQVEQAKTQAQIEGKTAIDAAEAKGREAKAAQELRHNEQKHRQEIALSKQRHVVETNMAKKRSANEMGLKNREQGLDVDGDEQMQAEARMRTVQNIARMFAQTLGAMGQIKVQGDEQLIQAVTAPRQVTTPDGRAYMSETMPPEAQEMPPEGMPPQEPMGQEMPPMPPQGPPEGQEMPMPPQGPPMMQGPPEPDQDEMPGEDDLDKDPDEVMMEQIATVFAQAIQQLGMALMQSNERVVRAITAPKQVTTPDGRTYTSETAQVQ